MAAPTPCPPQQPVESQPTATSLAVEDALIRQVEWYLGRQNLVHDYFLKEHMDPELWVSLDVILNFPKMKRLGVLDPTVVASILARGSASIDVDMSYNRVRPAWAKRHIVALSSVPLGTPASAVEDLFSKRPETPRPMLIFPAVDKEGTWHAVYDDSEDARIACDHISEFTVESTPPAKVAAHVFSTFDPSLLVSTLFPQSTVSLPLPAGQPHVAPPFYDSSAGATTMNSMGTTAFPAQGVNPSMTHPYGVPLAGPASPAYGYIPGPAYSGMGAQSVSGAATYPATGNEYLQPTRGFAHTGGYFVPPYSPQTSYEQQTLLPHHHGGMPSHPLAAASGPQPVQVQGGAPAAAVITSTPTANTAMGTVPSKMPGSHVDGAPSANGLASVMGDLNMISSDQANISMNSVPGNPQTGRRAPHRHFQQNGSHASGLNGGGSYGNFGQPQHAQGYGGGISDQSNNINFIGRSGPGHFGSRAQQNGYGPVNHGHYVQSSYHHPKQHHSTGHMYANSMAANPSRGRAPGNHVVSGSGDANNHNLRGPRSHTGVSGDNVTRQAALNKKHKRKNGNNRNSHNNGNGNGPRSSSPMNNQGPHSEGRYSGDSSDNGKDDRRRSLEGDVRNSSDQATTGVRQEPNLTAMNFPPLPGAVENSNAVTQTPEASASKEKLPAGDFSTSSHVEKPETPSSLSLDNNMRVAGGRANGRVDIRSFEQEEASLAASAMGDTSVGESTLTRKDSAGSEEMPAQVKEDKVASVSDVASTVSTTSTSQGNSVPTPSTTSSLSPVNNELKSGSLDVSSTASGSMTYAEILRTKSKKPTPTHPQGNSPAAAESRVAGSSSKGTASIVGSTFKNDEKSRRKVGHGNFANGPSSREPSVVSRHQHNPQFASSQSKQNTSSATGADAASIGRTEVESQSKEQSVQPALDSAKQQAAQKEASHGNSRVVWQNKPLSVVQPVVAPRSQPVKISTALAQSSIANGVPTDRSATSSGSAKVGEANAPQRAVSANSAFNTRFHPSHKPNNVMHTRSFDSNARNSVNSQSSAASVLSKPFLSNGSTSASGQRGAWAQKAKLWAKNPDSEKPIERNDP